MPTQPESLTTHLRALDSYWFYDKPLSQKLAQFAKTYAYGMSPAYWFIPNETDLVRHRMLGYGNINIWLLPFFLIGVGMSLWRTIKGSAPYRVLLSGNDRDAGWRRAGPGGVDAGYGVRCARHDSDRAWASNSCSALARRRVV